MYLARVTASATFASIVMLTYLTFYGMMYGDRRVYANYALSVAKREEQAKYVTEKLSAKKKREATN